MFAALAQVDDLAAAGLSHARARRDPAVHDTVHAAVRGWRPDLCSTATRCSHTHDIFFCSSSKRFVCELRFGMRIREQRFIHQIRTTLTLFTAVEIIKFMAKVRFITQVLHSHHKDLQKHTHFVLILYPTRRSFLWNTLYSYTKG